MELLSDPWFVAAALLGVTLLGVSKGGFFGLGVMALPLMSLFVSPLQAAAIILPTALAQDVLTVWTYRRNWSAWNLKLMLPSMTVGIGVAWLMAASLSPAHIRLAIGLIAALFVIRHWLAGAVRALHPAQRRDRRGLRRASAASPPCWPTPAGRPGRCTCCRSGSTSSPMSAPSPSCLRSSNLIKVPAFATLGYLTWDNMLVGSALVPVAVASNYFGIWLVRRTPVEMFFRIAYVLMFLIAVELIRGSSGRRCGGGDVHGHA